MGNQEKVPSVISYSLKTNKDEQQWGSDISRDAIAMKNTKLQLDVDDTSTELEQILEALDGMHNLDFRYIKSAEGRPKYTSKGPEEIVGDYLEKVFFYLLEAISFFTEEFRRRIPVDIVVTMPVVSIENTVFIAQRKLLTLYTRIGATGEKTPLSGALPRQGSIEKASLGCRTCCLFQNRRR